MRVVACARPDSYWKYKDESREQTGEAECDASNFTLLTAICCHKYSARELTAGLDTKFISNPFRFISLRV